MAHSRLPDDIIRLLLVTPKGALWETVRPMSTCHDDALAFMAVTVMAQTVVDARLTLARTVIGDRARAGEIEAILKDFLR